jgi:hypothetical protein
MNTQLEPSAFPAPASTAALRINRTDLAHLALRFAPLLFFSVYLAATVLLFAYGPWRWPVRNPLQLYSFLFYSQVALFFGYCVGALRRPRGYYAPWSANTLIAFSLIVNLLLLVPTSLSRTGSIVPNLIEGLRNPGAVYYLKFERGAAGGNLVEYIRILLAPILTIYFPLAIFFWPRISRKLQVGTFFVTFWLAAVWIAIGTNKGVADLLLLLPWLLWASNLSGIFKLGRTFKLVLAGGAVTLFILFFVIFTNGFISRTDGGNYSLEYLGATVDPQHPMVRLLPSNVSAGAVALSSYITQGYYGLSLSLQVPFLPNYGIGNSMFLYKNAAELLNNPDLETRPYPLRLQQYGWDGYLYWSSIYPWIASDVTFPGTILVVALIGYLFARTWLETVYTRNPFAIAVYAQFSIMLFYFSANNQLFQNGEGVFGFLGLLCLWLVSRRKFT